MAKKCIIRARLVVELEKMSDEHGVNAAFWKVLASNTRIFAAATKLVTEMTEPSLEDTAGVMLWLSGNKPTAMECYLEPVSYDSSHPECGHNTKVFNLIRSEFPSLHGKAAHQPHIRALCAAIEMYYQLVFIYSAVFCELHYETFFPGCEWQRRPIWGFFSTLGFLLNSDPRVTSGEFLSFELFNENPGVAMIATQWEELNRLTDTTKESLSDRTLSEILNLILMALNSTEQRIIETVEQIEHQAEQKMKDEGEEG